MQLDLVIPAHNEEHRIDRTLLAYRTALHEPGVRFIVALDNCTDATAEIVRSHQADDGRVVLLEFPKLGKGGVLMEAFRSCTAPLVGFVDADCATPPSEIRRLATVAMQSDGAIASRRHPASVLPAARSASRRVASMGFAFGIKSLFRLDVDDTQCGAKVVTAEVLRAVLPLLSSRDFLFDVDLLLVARALGFEIREVPTIWVDQAGSRVNVGADARRMLASALRLWVHHRVLPVSSPMSAVQQCSGAESR